MSLRAAIAIRQTLEHAADVLIALLVAFARRAREGDILSYVQKLLQLRNGTQLCLIHVRCSSSSLDDQGTSSAAKIRAQAHFWVEIRVAFRPTPHWTRLILVVIVKMR